MDTWTLYKRDEDGAPDDLRYKVGNRTYEWKDVADNALRCTLHPGLWADIVTQPDGEAYYFRRIDGEVTQDLPPVVAHPVNTATNCAILEQLEQEGPLYFARFICKACEPRLFYGTLDTELILIMAERGDIVGLLLPLDA